MLHHVNLHHAQRRAGIVRHGVHGKVVCGTVGHQRANPQCLVAHQRHGSNSGLAAHADFRSFAVLADQRLIRLFDDSRARIGQCAHAMRRTLRQKGESPRCKNVFLAARPQFQFAFKHIDETLCRRGSQRAPSRKLRSHLREARAQLRRCMDHKLHACCAGEWRANESVWSLQQVVRLQAASSYSQMMQSLTSFENSIQFLWLSARETRGPRAKRLQRPLRALIPRRDG